MILRWIGLPLTAVALAAAAPPAAEYPLSDVEGEALVVPASSPVAFTGFEDHLGRFKGRFELTGTLVYRCSVDCDLPIDPRNLSIFIVPDPKSATDLPYWKTRRSGIRLYFDNDQTLADALISPSERGDLMSGKRAEVRKRVALTIDNFRLGIDCDSASYQAHFVELTKPAVEVAPREEIDAGCS